MSLIKRLHEEEYWPLINEHERLFIAYQQELEYEQLLKEMSKEEGLYTYIKRPQWVIKSFSHGRKARNINRRSKVRNNSRNV